MVNITDVFIGTQQSKFSAFAIFSAILAVCLFILFTSTDIPLSQRFVIVLFVIVFSIPSILMTLFELTCVVTGGNKKQFWWCHYFAWIVAAIIIIYSVIIIISVIVSLFTYNNAMDNIVETEKSKRVNKDDANKYAQNIMQNENKNADKQGSPNQLIENLQPSPPVVSSVPVKQEMPATRTSQSPVTSSQMYDGYQSDNNFSYSSDLSSDKMFSSGLNSNPMSEWQPEKVQMQKPPIVNGPDISPSNPVASSSSFPEPYAMDNYSSL
jgi:hypothetical protein